MLDEHGRSVVYLFGSRRWLTICPRGSALALPTAYKTDDVSAAVVISCGTKLLNMLLIPRSPALMMRLLGRGLSLLGSMGEASSKL